MLELIAQCLAVGSVIITWVAIMSIPKGYVLDLRSPPKD
jgi:hypothetical protein